jgi:SMI1 / KNR4 family (SUKH-1)
MNEPQAFWDEERVTPSKPVSRSDVSGWEKKYGVSLPANLAAVLIVQNGGGVAGTEMFIEPLSAILPVNDDQLDRVSEGDDLDFSDGSKIFAVGYDEVGATIALDYTVGPEPRVLSLWFDGAGESVVAADCFDDLFGGASEDLDEDS